MCVYTLPVPVAAVARSICGPTWASLLHYGSLIESNFAVTAVIRLVCSHVSCRLIDRRRVVGAPSVCVVVSVSAASVVGSSVLFHRHLSYCLHSQPGLPLRRHKERPWISLRSTWYVGVSVCVCVYGLARMSMQLSVLFQFGVGQAW